MTDRSYHTKEIISGPSGGRIYFFQRYAEVIGPADRILGYDWRSGNEVIPPITLQPGEFVYDITISRDENILHALLFNQSSESWIIRAINLNSGDERDFPLSLKFGRDIDSNMPTQFVVSPDNATFYLTLSTEADRIHSYDSAGVHKQVFTASDQIADNYSLGGKRLAISPDGRTLYAVTRHGDLEIFDAVTAAKTAGPIRLAPPSHGPLGTIDLQVEPEGSPIVLSVGLGFADGGSWYHRVDRLEKSSGKQPLLIARLLPPSVDPKTGLEEDRGHVLLNSETESRLVAQGFAGMEDGGIVVDPAKLTLTPVRAFIHSGLEEPQGLAAVATVIGMKVGSTTEAIRFFQEQGVNSRDVIFANLGILTPTEIVASLPLVDPPPGVIGLPEGTKLTVSEALALAALSKRVGPIYIINITRIISQKGETLLLLQAA